MTNTLKIAIYKARFTGELAHWAIHVNVEGIDMIYEVIGGDGEPFEYDDKQTSPARSGSYSISIAVPNNIPKSLDEMREILQATKINNSDRSYKCQKRVLEGLKDLNRNGAITSTEYMNAVGQVNHLMSQKSIKDELSSLTVGYAYEPY